MPRKADSESFREYRDEMFRVAIARGLNRQAASAFAEKACDEQREILSRKRREAAMRTRTAKKQWKEEPNGHGSGA